MMHMIYMTVAGLETCENATLFTDASIAQLTELYNNFGGVFVWVGNDSNVNCWSKTMYQVMNLQTKAKGKVNGQDTKSDSCCKIK